MRFFRRRERPVVPPTNIRIEREDGSIIPLQLVRAPDADGIRVWIAWAPDGVEVTGECHILADALPGQTSVWFYFEVRPGRILFLGPPPSELEMTS